MAATWAELSSENERLRLEVEALKAKLIVAKASPASTRSELPRNWSVARLGFLSYLAYWEKRGGDAAWRAEVRRSLGLAPDADTPGAPEPGNFPTQLGSFAEPAPVRQHSFEEVTRATPEAVLRAAAVASGQVVDLPIDATARAILRAHQRASDPDGRPL
jgi:hypothetical protein